MNYVVMFWVMTCFWAGMTACWWSALRRNQRLLNSNAELLASNHILLDVNAEVQTVASANEVAWIRECDRLRKAEREACDHNAVLRRQVKDAEDGMAAVLAGETVN